jgi:hypothetical protein
MKQVVDQVSRIVPLILADGSKSPLKLDVEESVDNGKMQYTITGSDESKTVIGTSEQRLFDALRKLRLVLERDQILLCCFGASENVYPSGMQVSMGSCNLAYRTQIGKQALRTDIVSIFDADDSLRPSTVEQQELLHKSWIASLGRPER